MDSVIPCDWLDADPRPTCVLDLRKCERNGEPHVESSNRALREQSHLLAAVLDRPSADDSGARARVWAWMIRDRDGGGVAGSCEWIAGSQLYAYTVKQRWRVIQWQSAVERAFVDHKMNVVPGSGSAQNKRVLANNDNDMDTATNGMPEDGLPVEPSARSDPHPEQELLADRNNVTEKLANTLTMIEMVDVGMFDYNTEGKLLHANEAFYKLSGHPRPSEAKEFSWLDCVFPEDRDYVFGFWGGLLAGETCNFEMKWKRPAAAMPNGEEDINGQWVLAACVPTRNEDDGTIRSISGCITDIAAQKRSQQDALKKAEALERAYASEKRFTRFAESARVGIYQFDLDFTVDLSRLSNAVKTIG
ncbi:hypothetical protein LTR97_011449 [Elasticomyces elasticus]|uniref:PAC domain-containing protein n=1 Tax=Elasticomyces elasticus TaxID=574655 RepID=A0AAN7W500_9PEZI|nr:hypothetical protein LTR97_011449 [Elasticomyces elasticus]